MKGQHFVCQIILLQKVYGSVSLKELEKDLTRLFEGLRVERVDLKTGENNWARIKVKGADAKVAVRLLERTVRHAPIRMEKIERFSVLNGIISLSREERGISVDVGLVSPRIVYGTVHLQHLRSQLVDGAKLTTERIVELFGLANHFPIEIRATRIGEHKIEAELTERQLYLYSLWINTMVDRLIVLGSSQKRVKEAVEKTGLGRDVVGVESLSLSEQVVVCKLGTDARGLISRIGRHLYKASLVTFSPRRILEAVNDHWSTQASRFEHSKYKTPYSIQAQVWKGK
ncbi:MAG: DUF2110 family protein [Candidatus Bathyarchaeota archaeon]|nr:DUF2110 family protein [Candidatus Bathyarchaeota archaeon]